MESEGVAEASRLSGIVGGLKGYSYLDQAELQEIDITGGIEDTLLILKSQLYGHHNRAPVRRRRAPDHGLRL